jgi:carbohydrate diacid regulator
MITDQIVQNCIDSLKQITKVDLCVMDPDGNLVADTFDEMELKREMITGFADSPADSQMIGDYNLLKVINSGNLQYILISKGGADNGFTTGKIAVSQLQQLTVAYQEKYDVNMFFQNLLLDNLLLVDIYNRAKKLHLEVEQKRVVFLIETKHDRNHDCSEVLKSLYLNVAGDYITAIDEKNTILIKNLSENDDLDQIAKTIIAMMSAEVMVPVRVSYGNVVDEMKQLSKSYKEAKMAMDVGEIFYAENNIIPYTNLGIGRLIYQLPISLCQMFIKEIFGDEIPEELDEETLSTLNHFFDNNLNVSETSRQLFIHRNTLVYRLEKLEKVTGLDVRSFDDAMTFKIALMVVNYMKYLDDANQ